MIRRAFTLIEIIVVLAIILVVAALLFPVLSRAKGKARGTSCLSNLMQLSKAQILYASDNSGTFASAYGERLDPHWYWLDEIRPYLKAPKEFQCPENRRQFPDHWESTGFALNDCLKYEANTTDASRVVMFAEVSEVGSVIAGQASPLRQVTIIHPDIFFLRDTFQSGPSKGHFLVYKPFGAERHLGGGHYAASDGHAVWLRPTELRRPEANYSCTPSGHLTWRGRPGGLTFLPSLQEESP